ncbi:hypothetical protein OQA88_12459 [Cercophora sp. LCS_1]
MRPLQPELITFGNACQDATPALYRRVEEELYSDYERYLGTMSAADAAAHTAGHPMEPQASTQCQPITCITVQHLESFTQGLAAPDRNFKHDSANLGVGAGVDQSGLALLSIMALARQVVASEYGLFLSAAQQVGHGQPPPTPPPVLFARDIRERQATSTSTEFTVTLAPDATCGYLSGSAGNPITCPNRSACTWEAEHLTRIVCGIEDGVLNVNLFCIPRATATDTFLCDDTCQSNSYNLLCTDTASPYCRTYAYPSGVYDFRCAASIVSTIQTVSHTYRNEENRNFITSIVGTTTPEPPPVSPTSGRPIITINSTTTQIPENKPPVGPIAGGVIGGLALIGVFILADSTATDSRVCLLNSPYIFGPGGQPPMKHHGIAPTNTYDLAYKAGHGSISVAATSPTSLGPEDRARMSQGYPIVAPGYQAPDAHSGQNVTPPPATAPMYTQHPQGFGDPNLGHQPEVPRSAPVSVQNVAPQPGVTYQQPAHYQGHAPPGGLHEIGAAGDPNRGGVHEVHRQ